MAGFVASSTPAPLPASAIAIAVGGAAASPVAVPLYDENEHQTGAVAIWRDGWTDDEATVELKKLFRCRTTHRHRGARAIDFRVRGVDMRQIRDYVWRTYSDVGVGWYPSEQFIHIDTRPGLRDTAWTFLAGVNRYHPYWAELARQPQVATASRDRGPKS